MSRRNPSSSELEPTHDVFGVCSEGHAIAGQNRIQLSSSRNKPKFNCRLCWNKAVKAGIERGAKTLATMAPSRPPRPAPPPKISLAACPRCKGAMFGTFQMVPGYPLNPINVCSVCGFEEDIVVSRYDAATSLFADGRGLGEEDDERE